MMIQTQTFDIVGRQEALSHLAEALVHSAHNPEAMQVIIRRMDAIMAECPTLKLYDPRSP